MDSTTSRRRLLRAGFLGALGLTAVGGLGAIAAFLVPKGVRGLPEGVFSVDPEFLPAPGGPPLDVPEAKAWVVNLAPGEGAFAEFGTPTADGGFLALSRRCTHRGCTVPWLANFDFGGQVGWFRCPCHGSTFTRAGIRVAGPPPRPLDTFAVQLTRGGRLLIDTNKLTLGDADNPLRAVPPG